MTKLILAILIASDIFMPQNIQARLHEKFEAAIEQPKNETTLTNLPKRKPIVINDYPEIKDVHNNYASHANAVYAIELDTNFILLNKDAQVKIPMASLTKLMTAYIAFEKLDLNKYIIVPNFTLRPDESMMGLIPGESISTNDLLHGLLINSAGDATTALAIEISGSKEAFVELMNQKAKHLGLTNTNFSNPEGMDDPNHYSSAKDMVNLSRILLNKTEFRNMVKTRSYITKSKEGRTHYLANTNKILDNKLIFGIKTGKTENAGECLIVLAKIQENDVIIAVMGSDNRFLETINIIDWINGNYKW